MSESAINSFFENGPLVQEVEAKEVAELLAGYAMQWRSAMDQSPQSLVRVIGWLRTDFQAMIVAERVTERPMGGTAGPPKGTQFTAEHTMGRRTTLFGIACFNQSPEFLQARENKARGFQIVPRDDASVAIDEVEKALTNYVGAVKRAMLVPGAQLDTREMEQSLGRVKWTNRTLVSGVHFNVDRSRFPHTCGRCGSPAYVGFNSTECSKPDCK